MKEQHGRGEPSVAAYREAWLFYFNGKNYCYSVSSSFLFTCLE
jgi:hypothetical protein